VRLTASITAPVDGSMGAPACTASVANLCAEEASPLVLCGTVMIVAAIKYRGVERNRFAVSGKGEVYKRTGMNVLY